MELGIKSLARTVAQPEVPYSPKPTGFAAYRATVDVQKMKDDPDISWLLDTPALNIWYGTCMALSLCRFMQPRSS